MAESQPTAKKYLIFKLDQEEYGIEIHKITTIIEKEMSIARVPKTPLYIKGVINLRGEIIPIMSLRLRFGLQDDVFNEESRIVIVRLDDVSVGLIADSVAEVLTLDDESTENIGVLSGGISIDYLAGVGKFDDRIITMLNLEKLISIGTTK